jgi:hypothetical protein
MAPPTSRSPVLRKSSIATVCPNHRHGRGYLDSIVSYTSERVIRRARRFHRDYSGPATSYVREFDDQLHAALS